MTRRRGAFKAEVQHGTEREFIADKLAERDARHRKMGDTRYVVEPNVKEGKGGLRDLHALFWIGKYIYDVQRGADLVGVGLLTPRKISSSTTAPTISCRPCAATCTASPAGGGSPDVRRAARSGGADALFRPPGKPAVERFMHITSCRRAPSAT